MKKPKRKFEDTLPAALDAAAGMLSRREHSRREVAQKLAQKGFPRDIVDEALLELVQRDWLNEGRYAAFVARHRASQGKGPRWVQSELSAQGIDGILCHQALNQSELNWEQACVSALRRMSATDPEAKIRQKLYQRGFDGDHIAAALKQLHKP